MDDSDKGAPEASGAAGAAAQMPIGGMVRDPREIKTNPSLTRFLRERMTAGGHRRPRRDRRAAAPHRRRRARAAGRGRASFAFLGSIFAIVFVWTSVHIVQPGTVAVPVTLGHPGKPLEPGLPHHAAVHDRLLDEHAHAELHDELDHGRGQKGNTDDCGRGARPGRWRGHGERDRAVPASTRQGHHRVPHLGTNYATAVVRPSARSCIRARVHAATTSSTPRPPLEHGRDRRRHVHEGQARAAGPAPPGLPAPEVTLEPEHRRSRSTTKVAAQQIEEQQQFELATAQQQADITRIQALATADSQQILACGGDGRDRCATTVSRCRRSSRTRSSKCSQAQLTPAVPAVHLHPGAEAARDSPNTTTLVLPFDKNLTPLITRAGTASSGQLGIDHGRPTTPTEHGP